MTVQSPQVRPISAARQYEVMLTALHELMAEGKSDTDEAEAIRDEMDRVWPQLDEKEIDFLRGLSSDLYVLTGDEVYEPYSGTQFQLRADLQTAHSFRDYSGRLRLLRKNPLFLTPYAIAFLRARAYDELGHLDTALLFMRHAVKLYPQRDLYKLSVLDILRRLGRHRDVLVQATSDIEEGVSLEFQIQAADVLYLSATELPPSEAPSLYERAVDLLQQGLGQGQGTWPVPSSLVADGYVTLGACFMGLQQTEKAREAFNKALEIEALNRWALIARDALQPDPDQKNTTFDLRSSQGERYRGGRELSSSLNIAV